MPTNEELVAMRKPDKLGLKLAYDAGYAAFRACNYGCPFVATELPEYHQAWHEGFEQSCSDFFNAGE